jgi:hypothetical protein
MTDIRISPPSLTLPHAGAGKHFSGDACILSKNVLVAALSGRDGVARIIWHGDGG